MAAGRRGHHLGNCSSPDVSGRKRKISEKDIAEYLAKKARKIARKLKSQTTVFGYSNDSNRFGDSNLSEKFVWQRKIQRDVSQGAPLDEFSLEAERKRQRQRNSEIENIRKRREERKRTVFPTRAVEAEIHNEDEAEVAAGSYSPHQLLWLGDEFDPDHDRAISERKRIAVKGDCPPPTEDNSEKSATKAMEEGDVVFGWNDEINLDSEVYWWHDQYRPRKPKYFGRVHTGYEWNRYNRTHYDHDNPPPKFVQGYKFDVFYPDLVDKSKAPTYTIEKDGDSAETCIMRFHAGPPYEDIAFRIVNNEWEYARRKGFKCTFEGGILHVYFNFKRYRYRR